METKRVTVNLAQGRTQPFEISATEGIGHFLSLESQGAEMDRQAEAIVNTLRNSLPQGTWRRVIALIALKWASEQFGILTTESMEK